MSTQVMMSFPYTSAPASKSGSAAGRAELTRSSPRQEQDSVRPDAQVLGDQHRCRQIIP
ncbi:hypothetical protein ACN2WE_00720 [Streptomyces sp. cg28]|uniref:hypothetical protein n=1 Tax=Streptomyces sp. cg28 TaxID=3403457 RepID=UPI003B20F55D